jgi:hypothetical protein
MKADREEFETARARKPHWVGNDPLLEIGRARFLVMTVRVKWCRPGNGPCTDSRTSNTSVLAAAPGKRFQNTRKAGKERRRSF